MNSLFKRFVVGFLAMAFIASFPSSWAQSCPQCATEATQLLNKIELVKQVENGIQQLQTQLNMYQDMLGNSQGVPSSVWSNAFNDIKSLNTLIQKSKSLAYSAGNLDGEFSSRYGTYQDYLKRQMKEPDWQAKYSQWSEDVHDNALYTLKAAGLQSEQFQDEDTIIRQLQAMSQTSQGRMQALQVGHMLAEQEVRQVQKLRQLMMLQLQMQANYLAAEQDKAAAKEAARQQYAAGIQTIPTNDGKRF